MLLPPPPVPTITTITTTQRVSIMFRVLHMEEVYHDQDQDKVQVLEILSSQLHSTKVSH